MKKIPILCALLFLFCAFDSVFAYTPNQAVEANAIKVSNAINKYIKTRIPLAQKNITDMLLAQLPVVQSKARAEENNDRMYLLEYVRRHLPGVEMIDTEELLDDESVGVTWTHAPRGYDIIYNPYDTPKLGSVDPDKKYQTLINGGYFARTEGGNYFAGLLWLDGIRQTPVINGDPQVTHFVCENIDGTIDFWDNAEYTSEDQLNSCHIAFQAGPLLYEKKDGVVSENLAEGLYIGRSHARTIMVVFTREDETQDTWFLTAYKKMTLKQVRDIVLNETRFRGTYRDLAILNLDGGSSVAYLSLAYPDLNFGTGKTLPVVFGIR